MVVQADVLATVCGWGILWSFPAVEVRDVICGDLLNPISVHRLPLRAVSALTTRNHVAVLVDFLQEGQ